jgi:hypothetical protein
MMTGGGAILLLGELGVEVIEDEGEPVRDMVAVS